MGKNEMNMGSGNNYNGNTKITSKTTINKGKTIISVTIIIVLFVIIAVSLFSSKSKMNITGKWLTDNGESIEFLSDGTVHTGTYDHLHPDTYEIMEEGYLKLGEYDAAWIDYQYTYWDIKINGKHMTLTLRDNPNKVIELTKE